MKGAKLTKGAILTAIILAGAVLLVLQLLEGGQLRAATSSEMAGDGTTSVRAITEGPLVELIEQRDDHTRVWEITKEVVTTHPDGRTTVETIKSCIHEKGSGLCYRDTAGKFIPSTAEWRETSDGFIIDRCAYGLSIGKTVGARLRYIVDGKELLLRPAYLMISDGANEAHLAVLNPSATGFIVPGSPSVIRFPSAFGPGYDLEYVVETGGFHQNVLIAQRPVLPPGFDAARTGVYLYTQMNLDEYLTNSGLKVFVEGEPIDAAPAGFLGPASRGGCISFCRTDGSALESSVVIHAFCESAVADSSPSADPANQTLAEKRLLKDPRTGSAYLVESLPGSYFFKDGLSYPVTWDFVQRSGTITYPETWEPRFTYWITATLTVRGTTLTILPGTTVKLNPSTKIAVTSGKVIARGEPYSYIAFTNATDTNCGETIPGAPTGRWDRVFDIASGGSPSDSVIQYCKLGHGGTGIGVRKTLNQPVAHNIFNDMDLAMNIQSCSATVHNNLMVSCGPVYTIYDSSVSTAVYTNNTIDSAACGIADLSSSFVTIKDNLFSNCTTGITSNNQYYATITNNGFFQVSGGRFGSSPIMVTANPYQPTTIGNYFLNTNNPGGGQLRNAGSRSATAAGLFDLWKTVNAPREDVPEVIGWGEWRYWERVFPDTGEVDIGYHHCRVDYVLTHDVTVGNFSQPPPNAWGIELSPGVVVGFRPSSETAPVNLTAGLLGYIQSNGVGVCGAVCRFASDRGASMQIASPWWLYEVRGKVVISTNSSGSTYDGSFLKDTCFGSGVALEVHRTLTSPRALWGNEFQSSSYGLRCTASNSVGNSLFVGNYDGLLAYHPVAGGELAGELTLTNCTFSDNENGVHAGGVEGTQNKITVKDCVFTHSPTSGSPTFAIRIHGDDCALDESYNGFFRPGAGTSDHVWFNTGWVPINPQNSLNLSQKPYDISAQYARRFLLSQSSACVNAGSSSSEGVGMNVETTSLASAPDQGIVDMGYHYRLLPGALSPPGPQNVVVLYNSNPLTPEGQMSTRIKNYYCSKRGIPADNELGIILPPGDAWSSEDDPPPEGRNIWLDQYYLDVLPAVQTWFGQHSGADIRFIVVCKGMPYKVLEWPANAFASITCRLSLWSCDAADRPWPFSGEDNRMDYSEFVVCPPVEAGFRGVAANVRFARNVYAVRAEASGRRALIRCLATMLNAYDEEAVYKMIDKSTGKREPRDNVYWVLDYSWPSPMRMSPFEEAGIDVASKVYVDEIQGHWVMSSDIGDGWLMGYDMGPDGPFYQWRRTVIDFRAANGAIEHVAESWSGRRFVEDPYGEDENPQGLLADAFHPQANQGNSYERSLSGGACYVEEPGSAHISSNILFPRYFGGYTLAEAYYMAMHLANGKVLVVGDPLMTIE